LTLHSGFVLQEGNTEAPNRIVMCDADAARRKLAHTQRFGHRPAVSKNLAAPACRGTTTLNAGRRLAWSEWGPEDGAPVLFSPGAGTSSLLGFATDALGPLGVRLIALDRPGLGRSDPAPARTLVDFAGDMRALCAARGLAAPAIVGFSQGAPFALACAAAHVVSAVAVVAGTDELAAPETRNALPADLGRLVDDAERDPEGAEAFFRGMTPAMLRGMIFTSSPDVDLAVYRDPHFEAVFAAALDEGFSQGSAGYARDTRLAMSRWNFDPSTIASPVRLWYGSLDGNPVHSLDLGESLARRIPGAERSVLADSGGALLWTHGASILETLVAARAATLIRR
jgi:pimeloyl-ACP methyl ester carboxylesterase